MHGAKVNTPLAKRSREKQSVARIKSNLQKDSLGNNTEEELRSRRPLGIS